MTNRDTHNSLVQQAHSHDRVAQGDKRRESFSWQVDSQLRNWIQPYWTLVFSDFKSVVMLSFGFHLLLSVNCHPDPLCAPLPSLLSPCLPVPLSVCLSTCLPVYLFPCQSVSLSTCLPVHLCPCQSVSLSTCLPVYLSPCLSLATSLPCSLCQETGAMLPCWGATDYKISLLQPMKDVNRSNCLWSVYRSCQLRTLRVFFVFRFDRLCYDCVLI